MGNPLAERRGLKTKSCAMNSEVPGARNLTHFDRLPPPGADFAIARYDGPMRLLASSIIVFTLSAQAPTQPAMTLTVPGFPDGGQIPVKFSQAAPGVAVGEGTSPAMSWAHVPAGTQSFFLHMHDMDVARNKTTDDQAHWVFWNIPATATGLPEGVPKGSQLPDGSYQISATGPMYRGPGAGANGPFHHYMFELYALDTRLDVKPSTDAFETRANVMKAIQGHILAKAVYGGLFRRPQ
jgi:Raf kinase inhibitor-like YbhB/YbcL family protein